MLHRLVALEERAERHRVSDHVLVHDPQDLLVDPAMQRLEEMFGAQLHLHVLAQPVVDHHRTEQRGFRLDILGQRGRFRLSCGGRDSVRFGHRPLICPSAAGLNPDAQGYPRSMQKRPRFHPQTSAQTVDNSPLAKRGRTR